MLPRRYSVENLTKALTNPRLFFDEFRRWYFRVRYGDCVDVMTEDWDNLILLDACRYDIFSKINPIEGKLESRISMGSTSRGFMLGNFEGRELHDTVYITANPYAGLVDPSVFHALITLLDRWDEESQTVKPETVKTTVEQVYEAYTDKRIIIHFMQPHQPYLGQKSEEIKRRLSDAGVRGWDNTLRSESGSDGKHLDGLKQLNAPKHPDSEVTKHDVTEAYAETLEIVLECVQNLIDVLDGKTVISSDHGEMLGEKLHPFSGPVYGHPGGAWTPELRVVPWLNLSLGERRDISADPPERYEALDQEELDSKLEALGYNVE